jgi:hypothetical protein
MFEETRHRGGHRRISRLPWPVIGSDNFNRIDDGGMVMKFQNWKKQSARRKAIWPGDMKGYLQRQQKVTISIDSTLAEWLINNVVGRSSFTGDMEETVITALRIARGELSMEYFPNHAKGSKESAGR